MKAILVGASGATGSSLLFQLLENKNYSGVLILVRRELRIQHAKLKQLVIDFDRIDDYADQIKGDVVFCCIGSTKSKTPDENEYRKIDCQYPADLGRIALKNGAESFHLVSFIRADASSSSLYIRIKGEAEDKIRTIPFPTLHIYRPALFETPRKDKRFKESMGGILMQAVNPLLIGRFQKYRSIKVEAIARAMIKLSLEDRKGIFIHESDEILRLSREDNVPYR